MCLDFHAWIHGKNMEEMICKDAKKKWSLMSFNMQFQIQAKGLSIVTISFLNIFNSKLKYHKEVKDKIDKIIFYS